MVNATEMSIVDLTHNKTHYLTDDECRILLEKIYSGDSIVIPVSDEHARNIIQMASYYLDNSHQQTLQVLKHNFDNIKEEQC
jgi:hypothetical protein